MTKTGEKNGRDQHEEAVEKRQSRRTVDTFSSPEDSLLPPEDVSRLKDIIYDRERTIGLIHSTNFFVLPDIDNDEYSGLSKERKAAISKNLEVLHAIIGHRGTVIRNALGKFANTTLAEDLIGKDDRSYVKAVFGRSLDSYFDGSIFKKTDDQTDEMVAFRQAAFLQKLFTWSTDTVTREARSRNRPQSADERHPHADFSALWMTPPQLFAEVAHNPHLLYERIVFLKDHPTVTAESFEEELFKSVAQALNLTEDTTKWTDLLPIMFTQGKPEVFINLIRTLGFIPEEIYTKKKFRSVNARVILEIITRLKDAPGTEDEQRAFQYERARLLNKLITSGQADQPGIRIKKIHPLVPDSRGIMIRLHDFTAHIPYGLVSEDLLTTMADKSGGWCSAQTLNETQLRAADSNNNYDSLEDARATELSSFVKSYDSTIDTKTAARTLVQKIVKNPTAFAEYIYSNGLLVPDLVVIEAKKTAEGPYSLMRLAEIIAHKVSVELTTSATPKTTHETPSNIQHMLTNADTVRGVYFDPKYYAVVKIVQQLFRGDDGLIEYNSDPDRDGAYVVGIPPHGDSKKDRYIAVTQAGRTATVLLHTERHLDSPDRKCLYNNRVQLDTATFTQWAETADAISRFAQIVSELETYIRTQRKGWNENFILHFQRATALCSDLKRYGDTNTVSSIDLPDSGSLTAHTAADILKKLRAFGKDAKEHFYAETRSIRAKELRETLEGAEIKIKGRDALSVGEIGRFICNRVTMQPLEPQPRSLPPGCVYGYFLACGEFPGEKTVIKSGQDKLEVGEAVSLYSRAVDFGWPMNGQAAHQSAISHDAGSGFVQYVPLLYYKRVK